ncbi:MAG: 4-(cytidine 5'-diphospho)-2-C-methyl-D-erythritol kinase [Spirochaetales bacterium]|nr:4-(cytidine 5'-diphospho)-2-C-methyl-D-erythritol kinase [Spirochaetales bacterium]
MRAAHVLAPAKVNLHLEVYARREDGFHGLLSVFQMVSLCDEITVRSLTTLDVCEIGGDFDFPPEENIIWKCCRLFREATGLRTGLGVEVTKRIPQGAGLGGGSSDGAAFLRALNVLFGAGFSPGELAALGSAAGSDVPFFCREAAALVTGRGEFVEALVPRTDFFLVLALPPLQVSTAWAFRALDEARERAGFLLEGGGCEGGGRFFSPPAGQKEYIKALYERESPENWGFFNSFYPVLKESQPVFAALRRRLLEAGALNAGLSGSGSAMFGVFQDEARARAAAEALRGDYPRTSFLSPLAGMPAVVLQ